MQDQEIVALVESLTPSERERVHTLLQGVPHSARARSEFNEWCVEHVIHPNDALAALREVR